VDAVARAFSSLARMDPDFSARADVVADTKRATAEAGALGVFRSAAGGTSFGSGGELIRIKARGGASRREIPLNFTGAYD